MFQACFRNIALYALNSTLMWGSFSQNRTTGLEYLRLSLWLDALQVNMNEFEKGAKVLHRDVVCIRFQGCEGMSVL